MIILRRLYSETGLFDEIRFRSGLNIIMGRYSGHEKNPDINGIGKSSVVRLIDLAFLSGTVKKHFRQPKYRFTEDHSYSLDVTVCDTCYTIKRFFGDFKKVWFGKSDEILAEYEEGEVREILANKLFRSDSCNGYIETSWYRDLIRFYIKDDLNNRSRTDPVNFMNHVTRLPYRLALNFFLLGLPGKSVSKFDNASRYLRESQKVRRRMERKLSEDTGKSFKDYSREIVETEKKIEDLEKILKDCQFLKNYQDIEKELILIAGRIGEKNREFHRLSKERESYRQSVRIELETDVEKVTKLYETVSRHLAKFVRHELCKILDFRKKIVENRKKFLQKRVSELDETMESLLKEIRELDIRRSKLLRFLDEQEALDSLKNTYNMLIGQKAAYEKYSGYIRQMKNIELEISKAREKVSSAATQVIRDVQAGDRVIRELKTLFYDIICNAIFYDEDHEDVKFDIYASASGRKRPACIEIDVPKSEALGRFVFKILAYDLTLFLYMIHNHRRMPRFLIHDGAFHGAGPNTLIHTLNYIHHQSLKYDDFQYIVTLNENEILIPSRKESGFCFDLRERIVASYGDRPENMFFKRSF